MRRTELPTDQISKAFLCPVCSKRKMFALKFGSDKGKIKKCQNCGYTNDLTHLE